jgi:hypothetical protein
MSGGQLSSQVDADTVAEAEEALSTANTSVVALETVALQEAPDPGAIPASTEKTNCRAAVCFAGNSAIVQIELPLLPDGGFVQANEGPEIWVSDCNVKLSEGVTVSSTLCASFGPLFVIYTVNGALEPGAN